MKLGELIEVLDYVETLRENIIRARRIIMKGGSTHTVQQAIWNLDSDEKRLKNLLNEEVGEFPVKTMI